MDTGLAGKSALVTGGASGIGAAIVHALAREGAHVVIADIDVQAGQALAARLESAGGRARFSACDVTDERAVEAAVADAVREAGALHVMVNNAGIAPSLARLSDVDAAEWDRVLAVNLRGVHFGLKHAARAMLALGTRGSIVNIASIAALGALPTLGAYGVAKAGVVQLTRTAAVELAPSGIRVNAVCPGWTETAMLGSLDRTALAAGIPAGRIGSPEEVANAAVFLASDAASYVTGSVLPVDGGLRA